jgi:hypothetical protein
MEEQQLANLLAGIFFYERLKECYEVKQFYSGSDFTNYSEREGNEKQLLWLETERAINKISLKLDLFYQQFENEYQTLMQVWDMRMSLN